MAAEQPTASASAHPAGEDPTRVMPAAPALADSGAGAPPSLGAHPRFAATLRRLREAAGLAGFVIAFWLAHSTHSLAGALARAIAAGLLAQIVVWGAGVLLGRQLVGAELRAHQEAAMRRARLLAEDRGRDR